MAHSLAADEQHERRSEPSPTRCEPRLYLAVDFHRRLAEEIDLAERNQLPLSVVVLQVPQGGDEPPREQRRLEIALRLGVRGGDLHARLVEGALAVAVLKPAEVTTVIVERLVRLFSELSGGPVTAGMADFPADATRPLDLLRIAAWRSLAGRPVSERNAEIEWLLGMPPSLGRGSLSPTNSARQALRAYGRVSPTDHRCGSW